MDDLDDDAPKKTPKATIVRRAIVGLLALACAGGWLYTRYLVKKETLGGTCSYDMHCRSEAPRCLRPSAEGEGVCSRPCDDDGDCAPDIKCVKVGLDEYDERGRQLEGGYCFPQTLLDARKKKKPETESRAVTPDSWIDVPASPDQLEGEVQVERGGAKVTYEVKGTLLRLAGAGKSSKRTIVDTATLRVYTVDDDKKTFAASQIATSPGEPRLTKTDRKDTVAGRACEVWQIDEGKTTREACVVSGAALIDPSARTASAWEKELTVRGVFPLRVLEGDKPKVVVSKLEARPVDASGFVVPKSYKNLAAR
ncbi:MAG: hypothetical protein KF850_15190 [Labilithrix sp.]|nr:hypothetical protein [Labilithrix sp.]